MYFVAKIYSHIAPAIIESFDNKEHAMAYAEVMTNSRKGVYIVLEPIQEYQPTPMLE